jgi:hypothetical protein
MKQILVILFALSSLNVSAQETKDGKSYYYYCEFYLSSMWGGTYQANLSMNEEEKFVICDENNEPITFKEYIPFVNILSKSGWIFVESNEAGGLMHYVLKKEVKNDEEAKAGLNLLTASQIKEAKKKKK